MLFLFHIQHTAWYMVGTLNLNLWQEGHLWSWILGVKKSGDENSHFWGQPRYSLACAENGCSFCRAGEQHQDLQHNGFDAPARWSASISDVRNCLEQKLQRRQSLQIKTAVTDSLLKSVHHLAFPPRTNTRRKPWQILHKKRKNVFLCAHGDKS